MYFLATDESPAPRIGAPLREPSLRLSDSVDAVRSVNDDEWEDLGPLDLSDFDSRDGTDTRIPFLGSPTAPVQAELTPASDSPAAPAVSAPGDVIGGAHASNVFTSGTVVSLNVVLAELGRRLLGCKGVAVVNVESGMAFGWSATDELDTIELRATRFAEVFETKLNAMRRLGLDTSLEDMLLTTSSDILLMCSVETGSPLVLFCNIDREKGNLALARYEVQAAIADLKSASSNR